MTIRAFLLGLALGLFIASFTYFNDQVIRQTYLIGNHLPASVVGAGLLLLLAVNPLLGLFGRGLARPLTPGEVAVVVAMGLAVCGWPGSNLLRYFSGVVARPAVMTPTEPAWRAQGTLSYVPGASAALAEGYVADWPALMDALSNGLSPEAADAEEGVVENVAAGLEGQARRVVNEWEPGRTITPEERRVVVRGLNDALQNQPGTLAENRATLEAALPGVIRPAPEGSGLLLNDGQPTPAIDALITGATSTRTVWPADVPWAVWWPTLRLWGGVALLLGLASLCMIVVVHPQWSQRELLPYPIVRFMEEVATSSASGDLLPAITRQRMFWIGFLSVAAIHTINGLHTWWPDVPGIVRQFDFGPLQQLFPTGRRVYGGYGYFNPTIYFAVIGFGFFIHTRVALSLGLSLLFWIFLGSALLSMGIPFGDQRFDPGSIGSAIRFGSYVGLTLMILYYGRRYYWSVLRGTVGLPRGGEATPTAVWAARLMGLLCIMAVFLLTRYGGLDGVMSLLLVATVMMTLLVLTRINVETGLFYAQPDWLPGVVLAGFFGIEGAGPEALVVLTLASVILMADPREAIAPYLANGLRMTQRAAGAPLRRGAGLLAFMLIVGLVVAVVATLTIQYNFGLNPNDTWSNQHLPKNILDTLTASLADLSAYGQLSDVTGVSGLEHFTHANPIPGMIPWAVAGIGLVLLCAAARMRLPWWPIHPVLFLVWGTYPANHFAFSFLIAAAVKWSVVKLGGVRAFHTVRPMMVGFIAAELLAVVVWSIVGTIYYFNTGHTPPTYRIFPG